VEGGRKCREPTPVGARAATCRTTTLWTLSSIIVLRLADSLPRRSDAARDDRADKGASRGRGRSARRRNRIRVLADPRAADIVQGASSTSIRRRYHLLAWCVMPTHVHVLVAQIEGRPLAGVVHTWKSFTAHAVNKVLGLSGPLWAREYFDRMMRDDGQVDVARAYIENNPVAAASPLRPRLGLGRARFSRRRKMPADAGAPVSQR